MIQVQFQPAEAMIRDSSRNDATLIGKHLPSKPTLTITAFRIGADGEPRFIGTKRQPEPVGDTLTDRSFDGTLNPSFARDYNIFVSGSAATRRNLERRVKKELGIIA